MADNVTINEGTQTTVAADDVSGVQFQKVKLDVGGDGVSSPFTGSITDIAQVHDAGTVGSVVGAGTISNVGVVHNAGTIAAMPNVTVDAFTADIPGGTLDAGTVVVSSFNPDPLGSVVVTAGTANITAISADIPGGTVDEVTAVTTVTNLSNGTINLDTLPSGSVVQSVHVLGTGGGTQVGTLVAPTGAGTSLYLTGLSIVGKSGTSDMGIANNVAGSAGAGVYARGFFAPGGGIAQTFSPAINLGTNGTLAYFMINAGTASFTVHYIVST